ncbi:transcriptional regulator, LacI family [Rhizobium sp. NFR07]|uniref:LacI family DNA-binding transcriptional regulator n=1 Tax=Rhizobium sp. NFR07 TaxID=1566262 RepID=UPI0008F0AA46|nr:LacI family DNA-binding transcriptional regulator [Rhizobium sp. NFR07]SFA74807.1 transcriptional regulator, LacI family [Rhizobium sp. NFR07]
MPETDRVTIRSLADEMGLSKYAVSRALAGKSGVSEETRSRICALAASLGYSRPMPSNRTREVAVAFCDLDQVNGETHMRIQGGIQKEAERLGIGVRMRWTHDVDALIALARNCDGMLLIGHFDHAMIEAVAKLQVPFVQHGWTDPLQQIDTVLGTDREAGGAVANYLLDLGHHHVAYVCDLPSYRGRRERYHGARAVMDIAENAQLDLIEFEPEDGFDDALQRRIAAGCLPTAFFCAHDGLALNVVSVLLARGYRIPEDLTVVGFGDFLAARQISPSLTTVRVNGEAMGAAALQLLLERVASPRRPHEPARSVRVVLDIVERRSSAPRRGS